MQPITQFSAESSPSQKSETHTRRLFFRGNDTGIVIEGERVSLQFSVGDQFLVATDYDYYDGSSNWFYLLSKEMKVLDRVSTPDYFGFIQDLELIDERGAQFGFFGASAKWELSVLPQPIRSYSLHHIRRRTGLYIFYRRYLKLTNIAT